MAGDRLLFMTTDESRAVRLITSLPKSQVLLATFNVSLLTGVAFFGYNLLEWGTQGNNLPTPSKVKIHNTILGFLVIGSTKILYV